MTYAESMEAIATDALRYVKDGHVLGLGSGRAASALVAKLGASPLAGKIRGIPTSLQIQIAAENNGIVLAKPDTVSHIDVAFDGADQIGVLGTMIKGGGGALLLESVLYAMADFAVIIADETKFVDILDAPVPVEIHPAARRLVADIIETMGGDARLRVLDRGYPMFTESGNIILDCHMGAMEAPQTLAADIEGIPGVLSVGIFDAPDVIYMARGDGRFDTMRLDP